MRKISIHSGDGGVGIVRTAVSVRWLGGAIYNNAEWRKGAKYERLGRPEWEGTETDMV